MTLHSISVVDHVLDEYRSYLRTEFQARDPKLRKALEDALDRPLPLAQEPFFRALGRDANRIIHSGHEGHIGLRWLKKQDLKGLALCSSPI